MKIVKSKDKKHICFLEGDTNIACLDLNNLKDFINDDAKNVSDFKNEVEKQS